MLTATSLLLLSLVYRLYYTLFSMQCLSNQNVNIAFMRLFREGKGKTAYSVVESDERIPDEILEEIRQNPYVQEILLIQI